MGRLIDVDAFKKKVCTYQQTGCGDCKYSLCCPEDAPPVEAIPKADYENRLKADLKAILVELQLEIEELCIDTPLSECEEDMNRGIELAADAIQAKINELKGNKDGSNTK